MDLSSVPSLLAHGSLAALPLVFLGALLTSLTPCIYPVIPITAETSFFDNLKQGSRQDVMGDYAHVGEFFAGFQSTVRELFANGEAPTDAHIVVDIFDRLIEMPKGERPLRTIAGLDFGLQAVNDATDPIRSALLESMGVADWDGPRG